MSSSQKIVIMQPYFLPYMGYWQLMAQADIFVVYDTIQFSKKGWINRNRFLKNGTDAMFSIPLKKDSDYLHVKDRFLADAYDREKLIRQFQGAYAKASYYDDHFPLIKDIIRCDHDNLFDYIHNSILKIRDCLGLKTDIIKSSDIDTGMDDLKGQGKVIALCKKLNATDYINPIGGLELYDKQDFKDEGIDLKFLKSKPLHYETLKGQSALLHMSILDVMMFNNREDIVRTVNKEFEWV
jgi:hypothetical protein